VLSEITSNNEKVNVSQVAKKLSISNSAIYKFNPEKIIDIKAAQERQKSNSESIFLGTENEKLKKELRSLKVLNKQHKVLEDEYKAKNESLWEHIQQIYNMYDEVLVERNSFAERLKQENKS
tara:strand:- start:62 stop:427 length:366 start_codon:yes stop_codon:yes gene_type:complete